MTKPKQASKITVAALEILRSKKLDNFAKVVIGLFTATFIILELSLLSALSGKLRWAFFFEFNGVAISMLGALWTALGVRMSPNEKNALLSIKKNSGLVSEEIINSLAIAARFASFGAYCILLGGVFLCIKIGFY